MAATDYTLVYGPQGEPVVVPNAEVRNWNATPPEKRTVETDLEDDDDDTKDDFWDKEDRCPVCRRKRDRDNV